MLDDKKQNTNLLGTVAGTIYTITEIRKELNITVHMCKEPEG